MKTKETLAMLTREVPKGYCDTAELIRVVNFSLLKHFVENEVQGGRVDWKGSGKEVFKFKRWLDRSYRFLTVEAPKLREKQEALYDKLPRLEEMFRETKNPDGTRVFVLTKTKQTKEEAELWKIDRTIRKKEAEILRNIIEYREFFWT